MAPESDSFVDLAFSHVSCDKSEEKRMLGV